MARVLILREAAEAERTAGHLASLGHQPLMLPLERTVETHAPAGTAGEGAAGFAATSARAIPALAEAFSSDSRPLFVVGAATGETATDAGFANVRVAEGAAATMGRLALASGITAGDTLLYAAGRRRTGTLERAMEKAGIACRIWEVYDILPVTVSEGMVRSLLIGGPPDVVLLLSAGQAEGYGRMVDAMPQYFAPPPKLLALSSRICEALPQFLREDVLVSARPSLASLFELIG
ncbi:hypothetical protein E3C22_22520 [Jiella endophytica]|uniref:Tetrapyrrole biosynthesis uroporphyrinogen III synthase domain-containing protein n=1 Tax=Jiella endophytica TaxID=2558362 RepID=A0A4Y8RA65_9HYPH|nr:uroporphyrinogen-III synthase [Jiella endophytica]TFF18075.1 hypothetical protein E3C22_22520 [Jiella endophytica]